MRFTTPLIIGALLVGASACGSDEPKRAETATEGDAFCVAAQSADTTGDAVDFEGSTPEVLEAQIVASLDAAKAALDLAPADIEDTAQSLVGFQQRIVDMLEDNDYDIVKVGESEEGRALFSDPELQTVGEELDAYLADKCGIASD
jgi:hypothetical protein